MYEQWTRSISNQTDPRHGLTIGTDGGSHSDLQGVKPTQYEA